MPEVSCGHSDIPGGASGSELLVDYGPVIRVDIGFDPAYDPVNPQGPPVPGLRGIHGLVDTGAVESCIDSMLAAQLNLPVIDRRHISGVGGVSEVNVYMAQVYFPELNFTIYGAFSGVHLAAGGQPYNALIGRTFLRHCTMSYDGVSGTVRIAR